MIYIYYINLFFFSIHEFILFNRLHNKSVERNAECLPSVCLWSLDWGHPWGKNSTWAFSLASRDLEIEKDETWTSWSITSVKLCMMIISISFKLAYHFWWPCRNVSHIGIKKAKLQVVFFDVIQSYLVQTLLLLVNHYISTWMDKVVHKMPLLWFVFIIKGDNWHVSSLYKTNLAWFCSQTNVNLRYVVNLAWW